MKTALILIYLALASALFASGSERYSVVWALLAWCVVLFFAAALVRIHAVLNAPGADE